MGAPELLYGETSYNTKVDLWSVGCIFAELMLRKALFPGSSDIDQLFRIFRLLGTPDEQSWPGLTNLPDYVPYAEMEPPPLEETFSSAGADALGLLSKILLLFPAARLEASEALADAYFTNHP